MHYLYLQAHMKEHVRELLAEAARDQLADECLRARRAQRSQDGDVHAGRFSRVREGAARLTARVLRGGASAAA